MSKWIVAIIQLCVQRLDYLWPKSENIWIFGSNNGRKIDGNPKAVYDGLEKFSETKCYYITKDSNPSYNKLPFKSLKPLLIFLRAKNVVISHGLWDTGYLRPSSRKRVIQTWHGIPVKRIGFETSGISKKELADLEVNAKTISHFLVSSDYCANLFHETLRISKSKFLPIGQPRNDVLKRNQSTVNVREKLALPKNSKLVLYAPTFRKNGNLPFFQFPDFDLNKLHTFLELENIILLLRPHISDSGRLEQYLTENIVLFSSQVQPEINEVLADMDGLITDYSSIFIDFLLLDRPILFTCYDYADYIKNERGAFLEADYLSWIPGTNFLNQKEFTEALEVYNNLEFDSWEKKRGVLKTRYHKDQTNNTTKLLLDNIFK